MTPLTYALDDAVEARLGAELDRDGLACLPDVVDPAFLARCRAKVDGLIAARGARYFSVIQPQEAEGGAFAEIASDPGFAQLMDRLVRRQHSDAAADGSSLYSVLRVIAGPDAATRAFEFHYDATVLTVLMPLFIPGGAPDRAGDLVAMPNARGYRRSTLVNLAEKALLQNPLAYKVYQRRYGAGGRNVVHLKPGNLYFFWGYRTFHGNLPCEAGAKRATLLFHYGDPHAGDRLTGAVLKMRRLREGRRLNAA